MVTKPAPLASQKKRRELIGSDVERGRSHMALEDLARHSGYYRDISNEETYRNAVLLQLELPPDRLDLRMLFATEFAVTRTAWNRSVLGQKINPHNNRQIGVVGDFRIDLAGRSQLDSNPVQMRMLTVFNNTYFFQVGKFADTLALNVRLKTLGVERRTGSDDIWLVRAEILSGGMQIRDEKFLCRDLNEYAHDQPRSVQDYVWPRPGEFLRGLFFTGSEFQIEVARLGLDTQDNQEKQLVRRFRLLDYTRKDDGRVASAVWEHTFARTSRHFTRSTHIVRQPNEVVTEHFKRIQEICHPGTGVRIQVDPGSSAASRTVALVERLDTDKPRMRECLRIDWQLTFDASTGFDRPTTWSPRTLIDNSADGTAYEFTDVDFVGEFLKTGRIPEIPNASSNAEFSWKAGRNVSATLPDTRLVGTADGEGVGLDANSNDLWFQANCEAAQPYDRLPTVWGTIAFPTPSALPRSDDSVGAGLSGPLALRQDGWLATVAPALTVAEMPYINVRLELTSTGGKQAKLNVFESDVTLDTPPFDFYREPLNDPESVPNERNAARPEALYFGSLRFIARAEWQHEHPEHESLTEPAVVCSLDATAGFAIHRAPQALRLFLPAERGLVDPVSVTRGNLVARPAIAFPLPTNLGDSLAVRAMRSAPSEIPPVITELDLELVPPRPFPQTVKDTWQDPLGFYLQLAPNDVSLATVVARLKSVEWVSTPEGVSNGRMRVRVVDWADVRKLVIDSSATPVTYTASIGPTRLLLPRDVNHGLIPIGIPSFSIVVGVDHRLVVKFDPKLVRGEESRSVLALHPWSEWGPDPTTWIKTGRIHLHHRNLIQEHSEFESSFEDRFPPEGPQPSPGTDKIPSPLLPLNDFLRAVRDRYTEATNNLFDSSSVVVRRDVKNWLPNVKFSDDTGAGVVPKVEFSQPRDLPMASLEPIALFENQTLMLRKADDDKSNFHWLDVGMKAKTLDMHSRPEVILTKSNPSDATQRRAIDSSTPLLFSRHDVRALTSLHVNLGTVDTPRYRTIAIMGGGQEESTALLISEDREILQSIAAFGRDPVQDVALLFDGTAIQGLAILVQAGTTRAVRFAVSVDVHDQLSISAPTLVNVTNPLSLAAAPVSGPIHVAVRSKTVIAVVNLMSGTFETLPPQAAKDATAIAFHSVVSGDRYVAVAKWLSLSGNVILEMWKVGLMTPEAFSPRARESNVLGKSGKTLKEFDTTPPTPPAPILSLAFVPGVRDGDGRAIVAADGTTILSTWGIDRAMSPTNKCAVALLPSEALAVTGGVIHNLEARQPTADLPLLAVGLSSGNVLVFAALESSSDPIALANVRSFAFGESPVTRLTLPSATQTRTKLAADMSKTDTSLKVSDSNGFPLSPFMIAVEGEEMQVTARPSDTWAAAPRGAPVVHQAGASVAHRRADLPLAALFAGTAGGTWSGRDLRSGEDVPSESQPLPHLRPAMVLDALSVARELPRADPVVTLHSPLAPWHSSLTVEDATGFPPAPFGIVVDEGHNREEMLVTSTPTQNGWNVTRGRNRHHHMAGKRVKLYRTVVIERLREGDDCYYSISTGDLRLAGIEPDPDNMPEGLTDVRLWCNSLKVRDLAPGARPGPDGIINCEVVECIFPDGSFDPGHVKFFSEVTAAVTPSPMAAVDRFPRVNGVPFHATEFRSGRPGDRVENLTGLQLKIDPDTREALAIVGLAVTGVFVNPDDIAAGEDPADRGTLSGMIARARSRGNRVTLTFLPGLLDGWDVVEDYNQNSINHIDWLFSIQRQIPDGDPREGFPARLARLISSDSSIKRLVPISGPRLIGFQVKRAMSQALVFGRLWPFKDDGNPVTLIARSVFQRDRDGQWKQVSFAFETDDENRFDGPLSGERLTQFMEWKNEAKSLDLIAVDARTMSDDVPGSTANRYMAFHVVDSVSRDSSVYVADRTTGLALVSTGELFSMQKVPAGLPTVPFTAVLESLEDERRTRRLIVAAGRENVVEFRSFGDSLLGGDANDPGVLRMKWDFSGRNGWPQVRLCRENRRFGKAKQTTPVIAGVADFKPGRREPMPAAGDVVTWSDVNKASFSKVAWHVDSSVPVFRLMTELRDKSRVGDVAFLELGARIDAVAGGGPDFTVTLAEEQTLAVGDEVRMVPPDGSNPILGAVTVVGPRPTINVASGTPVPGMRLQRLEPIVSHDSPGIHHPTVRVHANTVALKGRKSRCVMLIDGTTFDAKLHCIHELDVAGDQFDIYVPEVPQQLPYLPAESCAWRAVVVVESIGGATFAEATVPNHGASIFDLVQVFGLQSDDWNHVWMARPTTTDKFLLYEPKPKEGNGEALTAFGAWGLAGAAPGIPIDSIVNDLGAPVVITTTVDHNLANGDLIHIAGVLPTTTNIDGESLAVQVRGARQFAVFLPVKAPPTAQTSGYCERLGHDVPISGFDDRRRPMIFTGQSAPVSKSRFRIVIDGIAAKQTEVFIALPISSTSWESVAAVPETGFSARWWTVLASVTTIDVAGTMNRVRVLDPDWQSTPAAALIPYDRAGRLVELYAHATAMPRSEAINGEWAYLGEEQFEFAEEFDWTVFPTLGAAVVWEGPNWGQELVFDSVFFDGAQSIPRGTTGNLGAPIEHWNVVRWGQHFVGITATRNDVVVWVLDTHQTAPDQQSLGIANAKSLAQLVFSEKQDDTDPSLIVAVHHGTTISIFRLMSPQTVLSRFDFLAADSRIGNSRAVLALSTFDGAILLSAGLDGRGSAAPNGLKTWRVPLKNDGTLDKPVPIWTRGGFTAPVSALAIQQAGACPLTLVGDGSKVVVLSPDELIRIHSDSTRTPRASLPIDLKETLDSTSLDGQLRPNHRIFLTVGANPAFARLEQGSYRCVTVLPTLPNASRGLSAFVFWSVGDLGVGGPLPDPSISSAKISLDQWNGPRQVKLTIAGTSVTRTARVNALLLKGALKHSPRVSGLNAGTTILRISLATQTLTLILEGARAGTGVAKFTGRLVLEVSDAVVLQAIVRCDYTEAFTNGGADEIQITIEDDVFWSSSVEPDDAQGSNPVIRVADPTFNPANDTDNKRDSFAVVPYRVKTNETTDRFVKLRLINGVVALQEVDANEHGDVVDIELPLIPDLEPSRVRTPPRLSNDVIRLAHRRLGGLAVRPDIPIERFGVVPALLHAGTETLTSQTRRVLEMIVGAENEGLNRLPPEGWLVHPSANLGTELTTEALVTLNPDLGDGSSPILTAIESRTQESTAKTTDAGEDRLRFRALLADAGAQGVALQVRARDRKRADIGFVDSPFYDHIGTTAVEIQDTRLTSTLARVFDTFLADNSLWSPWLHVCDPRFVLPTELGRERGMLAEFRYSLHEQPSDPNADICCLAHRHYRLRRLGIVGDEQIDDADTPILHVADVPAYRQPTRLSHPSAARWLRSQLPLARAFFPRQIDWETAAEKPGALMQTLVQGRFTSVNGETRREPLIDFAQREPQFIRLGKCVTAAVEWDQNKTSLSYPSGALIANCELVWDEIIGAVQVDTLAAKDWIEYVNGELILTGSPTPGEQTPLPLQLILDFNSDLIAVRSTDAAIPAYRVEAQKDETDPTEPRVVVKPASMWAVTKADLRDVTVPAALLANPIVLTCTGDGATWTTTPTDPPPSAALFQFRGFADANLNGNRRLVRVAGGNDFKVMQNTVHVSVEKINQQVDVLYDGLATSKKATIVAHRPFCIEVDLQTGDPDPEAASSVALSSSGIALRVAREDDAAAGVELRLARVSPESAMFLVLTPTPTPATATTADVKAVEAMPAPVGYLEMSSRVPTKVTLVEANVWEPAITLETSALPGGWTPLPAYVRVPDEANPHLKGVLSLLSMRNTRNTKKGFARPTCEPLLRAPSAPSVGAVAREVPNGSVQSVVSVRGPFPVAIEVPMARWVEGTAVAVDVVVIVNENGDPRPLVVKGTFVVRKPAEEEASDWFELHVPITPFPGGVGSEDIFLTAVVPLSEAFTSFSSAGLQVSALKPDRYGPRWNQEDRPILQIHWAASIDVSSPPGGIAWRPAGVATALYEVPKQIKFLANMQLSPKLAFVLSMAKAGATEIVFQRTILFGDAPPQFNASPTIGTDGSKFKFVLRIPNNREVVTVNLPPFASPVVTSLYVVKSLPSGIAVYDVMPSVSPIVTPHLVKPPVGPIPAESVGGSGRLRVCAFIGGSVLIALLTRFLFMVNG